MRVFSGESELEPLPQELTQPPTNLLGLALWADESHEDRRVPNVASRRKSVTRRTDDLSSFPVEASDFVEV